MPRTLCCLRVHACCRNKLPATITPLLAHACAGANPLQLDSRGRTPRQHCVDSKGEGALPDVPPAEKEAAIRRCTALLEAAEAAAAPELHRIKKSHAPCEQCGKQEDLKKCSG